VLIAAVAGATERIRVGSGGVMLPNHAPLVVAEQFGMLEALHPGRIDLGIGRAPGTDPVTAAALRRTSDGLSADDFPQQLLELRAFFAGEWPPGHPNAGLQAVPAQGNTPDIWLLGSSGFSAQVAGLLGLPFAFAHHFGTGGTPEALDLYRARFRPSEVLAAPHAMVCVNVICAPTEAEAQRLALPGVVSLLRLRYGAPGPFPSPEEAEAHPWTPQERAFAEQRLAGQAVGDPEQVRARLHDLVAATDADELMLTTMLHDPADRVRSFRLVADLATSTDSGLALDRTATAA
jgi:luciferase family oxidoreductase group 1